MSLARLSRERRYRTPPVVEAVCEFQFEPDSWDLAVPGLVYGKVRDSFPKRRSGKVVSVKLSQDEETIQQRIEDRVRFLSEDEKALLQLGAHFLAINRLKPYSSWAQFRDLVNAGLSAYREVASPKGIRRVGLRYINRIEFMEEPAELEDYFLFRPYISPELPQDFNSFISGMEIPFEDGRDILRIQLTSTAAKKPAVLAAILDLDYFLVRQDAVELDKALEWLDVAHGHVLDCFEASLTDRLKKTFEEVRD